MEMVRMARNFLLFTALVLCTSLTAKAQIQPHAEVFGGYSYMRFNPQFEGSNVNLNGWNASVNFKFLPVVGIVGDFAGDYGSPGGVSGNVTTYMFGPQISLPAPVSPFAHVLFGGAHINVSGLTDNSYAMGFGGGIDIHAGHHLAVRVIEVDDIYTQFGNGHQNSPRASAGLVLRF
jgi:hypothetical protein